MPEKKPEQLLDRLKKTVDALRANPRRTALKLVAVVVVLVLGGRAWGYRSPETWIEVSPELRLVVGAPQKLSVALKYRAPFRGPGRARTIPATIQLISFGEGVLVAPTTLVTTAGAPEAVFTLTGRRVGGEELIWAASNTSTEASSWRTASTKTVVSKAPTD